jgi:hypothetical protein
MPKGPAKGPVGGDPDSISDGSRQLRTVSDALSQVSPTINRAAGQARPAVADSNVADAIDRFGAAWSRMTADVETQLRAAALLARNGGDDLAAAGGQSR